MGPQLELRAKSKYLSRGFVLKVGPKSSGD